VHTYDAQITMGVPQPRPDEAALDGVGEAPDVAFASLRGTAAELVLAMYDRIPIDSLQLDGDRRLFDLLRAWE
jgi:MDMPI C-terminal domain